MKTESLNVLAIGGSNTLMLKGYIATLRSVLKAEGVSANIRNIALGANSCLMGLISLSTTADIEVPDVVIIEYAVNDYALITVGYAELWLAGYEGLVRQVSRRWPEAQIYCVILGRADSEELPWQIISDGTKKISDHYPNAFLIDYPAWLRDFNQNATVDDIYEDPMHYGESSRSAVGLLLAGAIFASPPSTIQTLPEPLTSDVFDPVSVISFADLFPDNRHDSTNSVVAVESARVVLGDSISVDLPGRLIAISFVSRADSCSFTMTLNEQSALVHTLHSRVHSGEFAFLPLSVVGDWWKGANVGGELVLTPVTDRNEPADWPAFHVGPASGCDGSIYLHQALVKQ
jgi:hypothetical protein